MRRSTRSSMAHSLAATLDAVPDELWVTNILPLLPCDARVRLGACARRWRALARHPDLWRHASIAGACVHARTRAALCETEGPVGAR